MSSVRFACPACGATHSMPPGSEGRKGACARCHQRLLIPGSPKPIARTVLARELSPKESPLPPTTLHVPPPEQPVETPRGRRSFRLMVVGVASAIALVALMAACAGVVVSLMPKKVADAIAPQPGQKAEKRDKPRGAEEELVATWVRRNVGDEVKFLKWGPHLRRKEVEDLLREAGVWEAVEKAKDREGADVFDQDVTVRVVFRAPGGPAEYDWIVPVKGKLILAEIVKGPDGAPHGVPNLTNRKGENWKTYFRQEMAKAFPGIKDGE